VKACRERNIAVSLLLTTWIITGDNIRMNMRRKRFRSRPGPVKFRDGHLILGNTILRFVAEHIGELLQV
jgi:hypothetical protein